MEATESTRAYPLYWPENWPRTDPSDRKWARFDDRSVTHCRQVLNEEVRRFGGKDLIISTNLELRLDGNPRSGQRQPADVGVAVYFKRQDQDMALACDVYRTVEDNLWALCRTLEALRQIERDGSPALINRAFQGFTAVPDPDAQPWWSVLHVNENATPLEITAAFRYWAKQTHPDHGGDPIEFDRVRKAYQEASKYQEARGNTE